MFDVKISYTKKNIIFFISFLIFLGFLSYLATQCLGSLLKYLGHHFHYFTITYEYVKAMVEISLGIYVFLKRKAIFPWLRKHIIGRDFKGTGKHFDYIRERVRAIVIPVSRREQPEWIINHLNPEYVAFLYTEQSKEVAAYLTGKFSEKIHFVKTVAEIERGEDMIKNPDDPLESKLLARKYIEHFIKNGIQESNIFVDTTGGKVPMSIGAFQAAEEMSVSSIYIIGKDHGKITDPMIKEHGEPIFISQRII